MSSRYSVCKKLLLSLYIKAAEAVSISQMDSNNNRQPNKIKCYKGPYLNSFKLEPSEGTGLLIVLIQK